jgi:signal transduction histidine kinase
VSDVRSDDRALRAATRRLAALTAAAVTVVLVVVGCVVLVVVSREQSAEARAGLRLSVADVDDLMHGPSAVGVWARDADGTVRRSPAAPSWLPVTPAVDAVNREGGDDERVITRGGEHYRLLTVSQNGAVTQAVISTNQQSEEQGRLLTGLVIAELIGLALSLVLGGLLARRAMSPLVTSMARQRRFVADASHELRTPLTLLSTRAQLLERSLRRTGGKDVHAESEALVADTRRLAEVVDDLLLSATLADQPAGRERVDMVALARAAVSAAAPHGAEQRVAVTGPADTPPVIAVMGAPGPLRRVLDALLDNAITHTLPGGHVVVTVVAAGASATVRVSDDGIGIDPAVAARLFDRFAHGQSAGSRRHFGLGLALVREIVQAHDGEITAAPSPGGGATFTVTLPRDHPRAT